MAQRRNASSPGRGGPSDLDDTKALAAKARAQTGGPILNPDPAELSGVRPRRDSVIGARLTPPPRRSGGEMPSWVWGVLGCLTVLLIGFVGLFVLARTGKLESLLGEVSPPVTAVVAPPPPAPEPPPAAAPEPAVPAPPAEPSRPAVAKAPAAAAPPAVEPSPAAGDGKHAAAKEHGSAKHAAKPSEEAPAAVQAAPEAEAEGEAAPEAKAPAKLGRAAAPKPAAEDEADEDQAPPGQDAVETALDALSTRVRGCFVKYQIKGTARVRLVATPGGTAESVNVTGEFEDTPTGLCVEAVVSSAKLPSFKGPPLKLSQSYQLR